LEDELAAIVHLLTTGTLRGPVNATAPHPVTNAEFTRALGAALHRPTFATVPGFALKLAFGTRMAEEMLLAGQRVLPSALQASGFTYRHPTVERALGAMLR
jgi:NAD dependent epimerase/dehydratase family enzyme